MKKLKMTMMTIIAIFISCVFMMGCVDGDDSKKTPDKHLAVGKVLILQVYGNAGDSSPNGVSHSFVELYNISDEDIDLSGISLYFADGISGASVTQDGDWQSIALTGTIPAQGSFLVLGKKHNDLTNTRYTITDNFGDINNDTLSLSRRSFKVALINGTTPTVQNPFNSANGRPVSGYIDMVGAVNDPFANTPDNIFGYEFAPARCSASVAVRRINLIDTDDNSVDFEEIRYASGGITDEVLAVRKPRKSSDGTWNPFASPSPPDTTGVDYTKLKLNEVSGVGEDNEKFYELINTGTQDISLYGCKIYYNANGSTGGTLPEGKGNTTWTGSSTQTAQAGQLFSLIGRNDPVGTSPGSFTRGLTAARILIITLEDPDGNEIDKCVRTRDTGDYAITDKSFSRIPDGTGDFYFTTPTPDTTNGASTDGLTKLPNDPPIITNLSRDISSVTPEDEVTVSATVTTTTSTITTVVLQWTLDGSAQTDLPMMASENVYSATIPAQDVDSVVTYKVSAMNDLDETNSSVTQNYTVVTAPIDYTKLVLNEISGYNKFVEIYNSGAVAIPMQGVKLQRNDGQSEWVGMASDSIPVGAYRLFLFNNYTPSDLATNPASVGWTVSSGISNQQILKVAIVDPSGNPIDVFIRGNDPLPAWGNTSGVTQDNAHSYSRMDANTWAYADPTPGAANGVKAADIITPGYLTAQP